MGEMLSNRVLVVSLGAWLLAQVLKVLIYLSHERRLNLRHLVSSGGMPSSHSALVTALEVLAMTCTMCLASGLFAVRKVHAADPADLF